MDIKLLKVLEDCGCLQHYKHFTGVTFRELTSLPVKRLKSRLTQLLSSVTDGQSSLVSEIATRIFNDSDGEDDEDDHLAEELKTKRARQGATDDMATVEVDIKPKIETLKETDSPTAVVVEEDDEIMIVGEVLGDVSFDGFHVKAKQEILQLTIDDGDTLEEALVEGDTSGSTEGDTSVSTEGDTSVSTEGDTSVSTEGRTSVSDEDASSVSAEDDTSVAIETTSITEELTDMEEIPFPDPEPPSYSTEHKSEKKGIPKIHFLPTPANIQKITKHQRNYIIFCASDMVTPVPTAKPKKSKNGLPVMPSTSRYSSAEWESLYNACGGGRIKFLDCNSWSWDSLERNDSPANLFRLLSSHASNLRELTFYFNCDNPSTFSSPLDLPNLKVLSVCQDIPEENRVTTQWVDYGLNYSSQLHDIILATNGGLEKVELYYRNEASVNIFLEVLLKCNAAQLKGLKSLHLLNNNTDAVALLYQECEMISRLSCVGLEDLFLEFCLWDNVKVPFEAILKKFPDLKKFVVSGCFITMMPDEPKIALNFPVLNQLEHLELGKSEVSISVFESLSAIPPKKKRKSIIRANLNNSVNTTSSEGGAAVPPSEDEECEGEYFSVTLNLPTFPKLKELHLGRLYELEELHFGRFPNLTAFKVSSPWQLSVKFPTETSRQKKYPRVKELQLPDGLQEDDFVSRVMPLFPNVEKCWINLPTVKVLRAFAFVMQNVSSLEYLEVATQFDFASSLDAAILAKPSEILVSEEEKNKMKTLKDYEHWEEYVQFHQIDVPVHFDVTEFPPQTRLDRSLEDKKKYAGLCVLNDKLVAEKSFIIRHVPRTLRLPRGHVHWKEENCKFSDILIGFRKFPFSKAAWTAGPGGIFAYQFSLLAFPYRPLQWKRPETYFRMDSCTSPNFKKKEEPE